MIMMTHYLGLFNPSSVSVSVSEPVAHEDELTGVDGSEEHMMRYDKI